MFKRSPVLVTMLGVAALAATGPLVPRTSAEAVESVLFLSPGPGSVVSGDTLRIRVVPASSESDHDSMRFEFRSSPFEPWTIFAVDSDGRAPRGSTHGWVGVGDGWTARLALAAVPAGPLELRASAGAFPGPVVEGHLLLEHDPTPEAPELLTSSVLVASRRPPESDLRWDVLISDVSVDSLLALWDHVDWRFQRELKLGRQDTMAVTDASGDDVSLWACGPVAAASCLTYFRNRFPALDQDLGVMTRKIAARAGTDSSGTADDRLAAAILETLQEKGVDPAVWRVTQEQDPARIFRSMMAGMEKRGDDKILLLQQRSTMDVNGDGQVDSTDVVGHYVTLSSRGTRHRDVVQVSSSGIEYHFQVLEQFVDFMDPATGTTVERRIESDSRPPYLHDHDLEGGGRDSTWIESVLCVKPPPAPEPQRAFAATADPVLWGVPVAGPGMITVSKPAGVLPFGASYLTLVSRTSAGSRVEDMPHLVTVGGVAQPDLAASPSAGGAPLTVQFANLTARPGEVTAWAWDLDGDGVTDSVDPSPVWTYVAPGDYSVTLVAEHANGSDAMTREQLIQVSGTASAADGEAPVRSALRRVGPNPAAGPVLVRLTVAPGETVDLEVFDAAGRRVRTLARSDRRAGDRELLWDRLDGRGRRLGPGLYLVRMSTSGGVRQEARVVLLR